MSQAVLRRQLRIARRQIVGDERRAQSQALNARVLALPEIQSARHVGTFLSMSEEIDTSFVNAALFTERKRLYLPVVVAKNQPLRFAPYLQNTQLIKGCFDISIPDVSDTDYVDASRLDVCLVPLVGFDDQGHRVGMGGGFYDRTFAFLQPLIPRPCKLIGVAYDCQYAECVAVAPWDVKIDHVITPTKHYSF